MLYPESFFGVLCTYWMHNRKLQYSSIRQYVRSYRYWKHSIKFVWWVYTRRKVGWHQSIDMISRENNEYGFWILIYRVSCRWHKSKLIYSKELRNRTTVKTIWGDVSIGYYKERKYSMTSLIRTNLGRTLVKLVKARIIDVLLKICSGKL
jgi:hypothetical protein